jgi:hypothetical protein
MSGHLFSLVVYLNIQLLTVAFLRARRWLFEARNYHKRTEHPRNRFRRLFKNNPYRCLSASLSPRRSNPPVLSLPDNFTTAKGTDVQVVEDGFCGRQRQF